MANDIRAGAPQTDHAESFVDLDDLDLAGIDVEAGEIAGGINWTSIIPTTGCTSTTNRCPGPTGPY
ncbi:hypothetical protein [Micromonospora okii]|uniref:hypothetical protein n=1 Tax=Micromonospora okii TaxID=1182970 RepID=UPI001E371515|nr:hypothetical protein [Micromonospora okii]